MKKAEKAVAIVNAHQGKDIPDEVLILNKSIRMAGIGLALIAIVITILMPVKPV